ncbi:unnamed protein product [Peniophora sp. CBMAI 1063]|nr:unnamed protein product [Peniophora sp. CBMAI 1063]
MMIAVPQPVFRGKQTPDIGAYLSFPRKADGGHPQKRGAPPGELGLWWELKEPDLTVSADEYQDLVVNNAAQLFAQARQAFEDFPDRQAFYSIFSAGLAFTLLLWFRKGKKRYPSRTAASWTPDAQADLRQELFWQLQDWEADNVDDTREATGNSEEYKSMEAEYKSEITIDFLVEMAPIPIYYRREMFTGAGPDRTPSPQLAKALRIAHSTTELSLTFRSPSPFDLPKNESLYTPDKRLIVCDRVLLVRTLLSPDIWRTYSIRAVLPSHRQS